MNWGIFGTSMIAWVILTIIVVKWNLLNKIGLKLSRTMTIVSLLGVGLLVTGTGWALLSGIGLSTASITGQATNVGDDYVGTIDVDLSGGVVNATTTSDYYNTALDEVTFYITDANIGDGGDINVTATLSRAKVKEASSVTVECNMPDMSISGISTDNLATKSSGKVNVKLDGVSNYRNDNTVYAQETFSAGTATSTVVVQLVQSETQEDGFTAFDTVDTMNCKVLDENGAEKTSFKIKYIAAD